MSPSYDTSEALAKSTPNPI
uniref:Uncharacterized protein n=1 Tax=Lepeophtheirus salmonis TaxID=72036 RepID=A0A0K2V8W1_LEPSM